MKLETLREQSIEPVSLVIQTKDGATYPAVKFNFERLAMHAFDKSLAQVTMLAQSTDKINQGDSAQLVVASWFLLLESFINTQVRILSYLTGDPSRFERTKKKDLNSRLAKIFDMTEADKTLFYSEIYAKLNDFQCFRNDMFHDRGDLERKSYRHTLFSPFPLYANQVDVMQAAAIVINVFNGLRYLIPSLDLMPRINISNAQSPTANQALDTLYIDTLIPTFESALNQHQLTSDINTSIHTTPLEQGLFDASQFELKCEPEIRREYFRDKNN